MDSDDVAKQRYVDAAHAMQTGVAFEHGQGSDDGSPKHLRVGVNSAMVDHAALVDLLLDIGVITKNEYLNSLADVMERERDIYQERINDRYPETRITLA